MTTKPLTQNIKPDGTVCSLEEYLKNGGYEGARKAVKEMEGAAVIQAIKDSNLLGRGGAGFNTGLKWSFVRQDDPNEQRYIIANGDEMEPGTFKDRLLLEGDPHQLIEGMIIAARAINATKGFIFVRWAYKKAHKLIQEALDDAYKAGLLGKNIMGSSFSFDLYLHTSVGRYICGEETALINSLEGKRANPRSKPPFPQVSGLFGKPTIVNNIETYCNLPHIIKYGSIWFKELSKSGEGGTKLYGVSGRVKNPGLWELPLGTTVRELLEVHAGGMLDGYKFRGLLPGGASTDFLVEEHLDTPMDFSSVAKVGSRMGTGTMIVMDDKTCPVAFVHNLIRFFSNESCGWCTPCRDGLPWVEKILTKIEAGEGEEKDIDILKFHTKYLAPGNTFCALAPGAMEPLQSALKYFGEDFERHVKEKRCFYK
ncbi:MAG TPA: NADH-quinone oxidoreductase subunit NuoF [Bacteroidales bacterium]|nr:NADH-quinone oxidoreductase subunit NuoF [Bacteroidales bacterium]